MDGKGVLSHANTAGTSKLDWWCFEYYQIDGNENLIRENLRKILKDKTVWKFVEFWKFE